jgi:hypothetical protein
MGVPDEDLEELLEAVKHDDGVGEATQGWLGRLPGRIGTGALRLGAGVTTEVVAAEIVKGLEIN